MHRWALLLIFVPLVEIIIYIQLGKHIGIIPTLALIFGTGIAGVLLARQQGFYVVRKIRSDLQQGIIPGNEMIEALLVFIGGILLFAPGLITDIVGLFFLLPFTRKYIREFFKIKLRKWVDEGRAGFYFRVR